MSFEGEAGSGVFPRFSGLAFLSRSGGFMAIWKKVAIVVVAWAASVFVYVEFFKTR